MILIVSSALFFPRAAISVNVAQVSYRLCILSMVVLCVASSSAASLQA